HGTRTGEDLFLHYFRHVAIRRPEVYGCENVPGMRKFPVVMEAMTQLPDYHVSVFCPVAAHTWLPQRRDRLIILGSRKPFSWRPCVAHYAKDLSTRLVCDRRCPHGVRPYSVREYARLQGVPDRFEFAGTAQQAYRQIGNGVPVPMAEWAEREIRRYFGEAD
ncbi:MAG: DNA cytosine methyltransferase, partial [Opitutaceae bacterium]